MSSTTEKPYPLGPHIPILPARVSVNDRILREICESQTSVISVPDLALEDHAVYSAHACAHVLKIQNGGHKTQNTRDNANWSFIHVLNGCEGFLGSSIHSSIHSFIRSFVRSSLRSFVRSFVQSFVRSSVPSFILSFIRSFVRSFIHSSILSKKNTILPIEKFSSLVLSRN